MAVAGGLGILAKGPVAVGFPFAVGLAYLAWTRRLGALRAFPWLRVTAGILAIALPWYIAVIAREGSPFFYDNIVRENLMAPVGHEMHKHGVDYYLLRLPLFALPWTLLLIVALADASWKRPDTRLPWIWFATLLAILTLSVSKRPMYQLFLYPPLALLAGDAALRIRAGAARPRIAFRAGAAVAGALALLIAAGAAAGLDAVRSQAWGTFRLPLAAAGVVVCAAAFVAAARRDAFRTCTALAAILAVLLAAYGGFAERRTDPRGERGLAFCRRVESIVPAGETIWFVGPPQAKIMRYVRRPFKAWPSSGEPTGGTRFVLAPYHVPRNAEPVRDAELLLEEKLDYRGPMSLVRVAPARRGQHPP
jgi:4-amino-4-deoxy-L-arabinose transferase-like glycosyltransferase